MAAAAAAVQAAAAALGSRPAPQPFSRLIGENFGAWWLKVQLIVTALPQARDRMLFIVQCFQGEALSRFFALTPNFATLLDGDFAPFAAAVRACFAAQEAPDQLNARLSALRMAPGAEFDVYLVAFSTALYAGAVVPAETIVPHFIGGLAHFPRLQDVVRAANPANLSAAAAVVNANRGLLLAFVPAHVAAVSAASAVEPTGVEEAVVAALRAMGMDRQRKTAGRGRQRLSHAAADAQALRQPAG